MRTVLVTGSEGNIGRYVVAALRAQHPHWKVLRIKNGREPPYFDAAADRYVGDLQKSEVLDLIFGEHMIDYVIHAASTSYSHEGYRQNPFTVLRNDAAMTLNVLKHSTRVRKLSFLSSALAYEHANASPLKEDATAFIPAPTSSYGVAKYFGEQATLLAHLEHKMTYTIWRPFNVVSPLEPTDGEGRHVFVDFFRRLYFDRVKEFNMIGSGRQVRCFIWVEEAAECIVSALENGATDNQTINLARNEPISLIQLKDLLLGLGKALKVLANEYDPPIRTSGSFSGVEMEVRIPSTEKLERLTQWSSSVSVNECFLRFARMKLIEAGLLNNTKDSHK